MSEISEPVIDVTPSISNQSSTVADLDRFPTQTPSEQLVPETSSITDVIVEIRCFGDCQRYYQTMFTERITNKLLSDLRSYHSDRKQQAKAVQFIHD